MRIIGYPKITVVGAFRSGTNFVQFLFEQNYRCRVAPDAHGWKHLPVPVTKRAAHKWIDGRVPIIAVIRNPLDFLVSLFRYRIEIDRNITAPREWSAFLTSEIGIHYGRAGRTAEHWFANPIAYWNALYSNLATLPSPQFRSVLVVYEAVRAAPEQETQKLAHWAGIVPRQGPFRLPDRRLSRGSNSILTRITGKRATLEKEDQAPARRLTALPEYTSEQRLWVKQAISARFAPLFAAQWAEAAA